jgi:hypothetical protein
MFGWLFATYFVASTFMVDKMKLIYHFGGSDSRPMDDNNSGFNGRHCKDYQHFSSSGR